MESPSLSSEAVEIQSSAQATKRAEVLTRSRFSRFFLAPLTTLKDWMGMGASEAREQKETKHQSVEQLIIANRFLHSPLLYEVYQDREDEQVLDVWQQEVDRMIQETKAELQSTEHPRCIVALGPHPSEQDIILYNIGRFLCKHKKSQGMAGFWHMRAAAKVMMGGAHHLRELGKGFDTCIDTSSVAQVLARRYGIDGKLRVIDGLHHAWQRGGDGPIIDAFWLEKRGGFLRNAADFEKAAHKDPEAEALVPLAA